MTVSVAGQPLSSPDDLSGRGRRVLGLIEGGSRWLVWATSARDDSGPGRARYHFRDETALVAGIQAGLHASPLMLLPGLGLLIGAGKLMSLDEADLRTLVKAEHGIGGTAVMTRAGIIFDAHGILTLGELADGDAFLADLGLGSNPLFQCMGLDDRLAIRELVAFSGDKEDAAQQEAAAFALELSRTPPEFADHYRIWFGCVAAAGPAWTDANERKAGARAAVERLRPPLYQALDCPRVEPGASPWEVSAAIEEWLMMGRRLGFARLSRGVREVIAQGGALPLDREEAERMVAVYLAGAQATLAGGEAEPVGLGQDGLSAAYRLLSDAGEGDILLGADGLITLAGYRPLPGQPAAPSPSRRRKQDGP